MYVNKKTALALYDLMHNPALNDKERKLIEELYIKSCEDNAKIIKIMRKRRTKNNEMD